MNPVIQFQLRMWGYAFVYMQEKMNDQMQEMQNLKNLYK